MALIEQVALRGRNVKHFLDDATGQRQAVLTLHDQHYLDDAQTWQDIDETFRNDTLSGFAHVADKLHHAIHIGATGTRRWMPRRDHPNEYIQFGVLQYYTGTTWINVPLGTATRNGKSIAWSTTNFDLSLTNNWHGVKINAVLKTEAARKRLRWAVSLSGLTYTNGILTSVSDGQNVGTVEKPIAWDANGSIDNLNVAITTTYSGGYLEFGGNIAAAILPITIDPTFTSTQTSADADNFVSSTTTSANYGATTTISVGNSGGFKRRGLLKIDCIASDKVPAGSTITSATLTLYCSAEALSTDYTVGINKSLVAWYEGAQNNAADSAGVDGSTWALRNENGSVAWTGGAGGVSGTEWTATPTDSKSITGTGTAFDFNVAADVTSWASGDTNYGWWIINLSEGTLNSLKVFVSSDGATQSQRPKLVIVYTTSGGTTYYATPTGAITPSGLVAKLGSKTLTGATTPSGTVAKILSYVRTFTGGLTPSGVLSRVLSAKRTFTGVLTPAGALSNIKAILRTFTGTLTPSGAVTRLTSKTVIGGITPTGIVSKLRTAYKTLTGALTPAGIIVRLSSKNISGATTPAGALSSIKAAIRTFTGALTPSGTTARVTSKTLPGALTPAGITSRKIIKTITGAMTPSGVLTNIKAAIRLFTGTLTASGIIIRQTAKTLTGGFTPTGAISKLISKAKFTGATTPTGALATIKAFIRLFVGATTPTGAITQKQTNKALSGTATPTGALTRLMSKTISGAVTSSGAVYKVISKLFTGAVTFIRTLVSAIVHILPTVTPTSRTYIIPAESRLCAVDLDTRILLIDAEDRVWRS